MADPEAIQNLTTTTACPKLDALIAQRVVKTTRAVRLSQKLLAYRCPRCDQNCPRIYSRGGPIRYVQCMRCGATGKIGIGAPEDVDPAG